MDFEKRKKEKKSSLKKAVPAQIRIRICAGTAHDIGTWYYLHVFHHFSKVK